MLRVKLLWLQTEPTALRAQQEYSPLSSGPALCSVSVLSLLLTE